MSTMTSLEAMTVPVRRLLLTLLLAVTTEQQQQQQFPLTPIVSVPIQTAAVGTRFVGSAVTGATNMSSGFLLNTFDRRQCRVPLSTPFPCGDLSLGRSAQVPYSVHALRPGDIQVVAALGDSLVAGTGALAPGVFEIVNEYRGVSFIMGGDATWREFLTLPNILKVFNPHLHGYSTGVQRTQGFRTRGQRRKMRRQRYGRGAKLDYNFAETGADSDDVIKQAYKLVRRMRRDPRVDFYRDWKMVTLLVGHNDICSHACRRTTLLPGDRLKDATPAAYVFNIRKALDILHQQLPRTFVSLMASADISKMVDLHEKPLPCQFTHSYGCPCLFDSTFSKRISKAKARHFLNQYLRAMEDLVSSGRYDTKKDFTVVLQPTLVNGDLPMHRPRPGARRQVDISYLAPDCFHLAQKSHAKAARALWNNLLQPLGEKTNHFVPRPDFFCPNEEFPFLATAVNSAVRRKGSGSSEESLAANYRMLQSVVAAGGYGQTAAQCPF